MNSPGFCARSGRAALPERWAGLPRYTDYGKALAELRPDVVSINTWPDTHADFAVRAFAAGAHVFVEKPLAETVRGRRTRLSPPPAPTGRKMIVGYSARHSPSWIRLVEVARTLGKPLVMRMNLNQQSIGPAWTWHRNLLKSLSPIVDCGVHYVDLMCLMTGAKPVRVHAIGARLSDEIARRHVQLRPAAGRVRRRLDRLVRGRLGPDDERAGVLPKGRDRPGRVGEHRQPGGGAG